MTVKIRGNAEDKARALLGGDNPTPARVASLLDELEQRRALTDGPTPERTDTMETTTAPPQGWEAERAQLLEEKRQLAAQNAQTLELLRSLEGKVNELAAARPTIEDSERAIAASKLPPPGASAPPLGLNGFTALPVGKWIESPLGPKVNFKICGCGRCTPSRLHHWFCCICKSGPHLYQQRYPHFTKLWTASGGVWGINHHACSEPCRMSYLASIGVTPGLNDHEPPSAPAEDGQAPDRPAVAHDSD